MVKNAFKDQDNKINQNDNYEPPRRKSKSKKKNRIAPVVNVSKKPKAKDKFISLSSHESAQKMSAETEQISNSVQERILLAESKESIETEEQQCPQDQGKIQVGRIF